MTTMTATLDLPRAASPVAIDAAAESRDVALGLPAALLVSSWMFVFDRHMARYDLWALIAVLLAYLALARPIAQRGMLRRGWLAAVQLGTLLLIVLTADRTLVAWEERSPRFDVASSIASAALNLAGFRTAAEGGLLLVDHPEGLITIVPSMEKLALRPFLLFWLAWVALRLMRDQRRAAACAGLGLATTLLVGMIRYIVLVAAYIEHDDILAGSTGQAALGLFRIVVDHEPLSPSGRSRRGSRLPVARRRHGAGGRRPAADAGLARVRRGDRRLGALAGLAWTFVPPGAEKAGRVLIDDRFCGIWEPTARQLDTEWYGDFSTYSFTSLAEWLGKWFSVDVNTSRPYDDDLLARYDVLIIKTPEEPIPDAEAAAIDRFVRAGGGLLLVGDHTNLLGMGTHLNALCARYGIRFRYDSVSDGLTGGFVDYDGPRLGRHVGALHVDRLEFMTSCSLQLSGAAETVLAAEDCQREPHDYSGSSFFGRRGPHPEMDQGRTVLAATVRVGRGRIAAFTDSTVWSSFAVFSHDREKLAMDLVRLLNREPSGYEVPVRCVAVAAALLAVLLGLSMVGSGMALPALLFLLVGSWAGVAVSEAIHRRVYAWPAPNAPISEVTFLWQGGVCAFPPVLGTPESLPADRSFDTLLVAVQRLGLVSRVAYTYEGDLLTPETRAMFVVAPLNSPPSRTLARLKNFVRDGGSLIVLDDGRIGERGSAKDFLSAFGRNDRVSRAARPERRSAAARASRRRHAARQGSRCGRVRRSEAIREGTDCLHDGRGRLLARRSRSLLCKALEAGKSQVRDDLHRVPRCVANCPERSAFLWSSLAVDQRQIGPLPRDRECAMPGVFRSRLTQQPAR